MTALEEQLAQLLKDAAGEPPTTIDADAIIGGIRRRRPLGPWFAAAAVVVLAISLTWVRSDTGRSADAGRTSLSTTPTGTTSAGTDPEVSHAPVASAPTDTSDPRAAALHRITALLATAPVPPGLSTAGVDVFGNGLTYSSGGTSNEVRVKAAYAGTGTVAGVLAYLAGHPPAGYQLDCLACGTSTQRWPYYDAGDAAPMIDYNVLPYRGGVYVHIEIYADYVPVRPSWSYVADDVSSVDVTVVRTRFAGSNGGAPTVHRTLSGADAQRLARAINSLSGVVGAQPSCPAPQVGESNLARFHTPEGDLTFQSGSCGPGAVTGDGHATAYYLDPNGLELAVLDAVGLPRNYGWAK